MKAALMMATYNRLDLTKRMLKSLFETTTIPFSLIIVDNGSEDGTVEFLKDYQWPCDAHLIFNEANKGIAVARNQTLKKADEIGTDWFCTIDNDVEMPKGWLKQCIDILKANKSYGGIGVNMEPAPYPIVTRNGCTFQDKPQGNLGTACMVFPKAVHQMLGFFTTEYGLYGEEDADWGMRTRVCGFKLGYIQEMGNHFGDGEVDTGAYRDFKTESHRRNLAAFNRNCAAYHRRQKPLYIPYRDEVVKNER